MHSIGSIERDSHDEVSLESYILRGVDTKHVGSRLQIGKSRVLGIAAKPIDTFVLINYLKASNGKQGFVVFVTQEFCNFFSLPSLLCPLPRLCADVIGGRRATC